MDILIKNNTIAVLITSHNRKEKTIQCLKQLFNQQKAENIQFEVFLVDDKSTDGTEYDVKILFPQVNIIKGDGELFWNRGMYTAWEKASQTNGYDFYLWLNDDTILHKNALIIMIETSKKKEDNAIIVGTISSPSNSDIITYGGYYQNAIIHPRGLIQECHKFNGNCVLIPNKVFNRIGNLDYYFRHTFGDIEYGMRARKAGYKLFTTPVPVGECERNPWPPLYLSTCLSLKRRLRLLYSPLGFNPKESFHLNVNYNSFVFASMIYVKIHLNALFPFLTSNKMKKLK